jgi:hypothetical protein
LPDTLDDFLGAIYALVFAQRCDFTNGTARSIDITSVQKHAAQMAVGGLRPDGKQMAGFHLNSALLRTLRMQVENLHRQWKTSRMVQRTRP